MSMKQPIKLVRPLRNGQITIPAEFRQRLAIDEHTLLQRRPVLFRGDVPRDAKQFTLTVSKLEVAKLPNRDERRQVEGPWNFRLP